MSVVAMRLALLLPLGLAATPAFAQDFLVPLGDIAAAASGYEHACARTTAGDVYCWGANDTGQLGDGTNNQSAVARRVAGLPGAATDLASGYAHGCAVVGGAVYCWGDNSYGQLGDGTIANSDVPVAVQGLPAGATAVTVGYASSCALVNGGVWCWGFNLYGSLGNGTGNDSLVPVAVTGLGSGITQIAAGGLHACALDGNGGAHCWGNNASGQVGSGSGDAVIPAPATVSGLASGVVAIGAGATHSCAVLSTGATKCWGDNTNGQLGTSTVTLSRVPVDADQLTAPSRSIGVGRFHVCAVGTDDTVRCWGANGNLQLGGGDEDGGPTPVTPAGIEGNAQQASLFGDYSCARLTDGRMACWGRNVSGQVGNGSASARTVPVVLPGVVGTSVVAAGGSHTCAVIGDGVSCWGYNGEGAIGTGEVTLAEPVPTAIAQFAAGATSVAAGTDHSCAVVNGAAWCWGNNEKGQLGDGTTDDSDSPVAVSGMASGVTAIAAGGRQTCAIRNGGAWCWGFNNNGELGDGTQNESHVPVAVSGLGSDVSMISVGQNHTCAVAAGSARCWGVRAFGQLGDGLDTGLSAVPAQVQGLTSGVTAISAGGSHTCAVVGGAAKCWGWDGYGQLGNGIVNDGQTLPAAVPGLESGVASIIAGDDVSCVVKSATVLCWGADYDGDVGDGDPVRSLRASPNPVIGLVNRAAGGMSVGGTHVCAITIGGGLACWGDDFAGGLGIGRQLLVPKPATVVLDDRILARGFD